MNGLFQPDGKIMYYGNKLAQLIGLQLLTLLCTLPIVTAGAAFAAMHKILLQIYRDEDSGIIGPFFTAFRQNFRQATILWLGFLLMLFALYLNFRITQINEVTWFLAALRYIVYAALIVMAGCLVWVFVFQSRYQNTVIGTVRLAFAACIAHPLYTLFSIILVLIPLLLLMLSWRTLTFIIMLGYTVPGILRTILYSKVFDDLEDTNWRSQRTND